MRLGNLVKMISPMPNDRFQIKFFKDEHDMLSYRYIHQMHGEYKIERPMALEVGDKYYAVESLGNPSNANFKTRDNIYTANVIDNVIELRSVVNTLLNDSYIYLANDGSLYLLRDQLTVELARMELQANKQGFFNQTALARSNIAAARQQINQPNLFQLWGINRQPSPSPNDPMDVEAPMLRYTYFGFPGSGS